MFITILALSSCQETNDFTYAEKGAITRSAENLDITPCATSGPAFPSWNYAAIQTKSIEPLSIRRFNVFVHVIRSSTGVGLNKESVAQTIISNLNFYYSDAHIKFFLHGSDYIDDSSYSTVTKETVDVVFGVNEVSEAINIYVLSSCPNLDAAGMAQGIPSIACAIHGWYYSGSTVPHEIGHCLGLYHTHHGTDPNDGGGTPELVDGSNAKDAGDFIADTPADPNEWDYPKGFCEYTITKRDANGQLYRPDPNNIMSYSDKFCRTIFTDGQINWMHFCISQHEILRNTFYYPDGEEIEGPTHFCRTALYNVSETNGTIRSVRWTVQTAYGDDNTNTLKLNTQTYTDKTLQLINNENLNPKRYDILADIEYTDGQDAQASLTVTSGETSPYIGTLYWTCGHVTNGQTSFTMNNGSIEIESNQTQTFTATLYHDQADNSIINPSIEMNALDLVGISSGNSIEITPTYGGNVEGDLEIYVANDCAMEGVPFLIPYTVFDVNEMSLRVTGNTMILTPNAGNVSARVTPNADTSISEVQILTTDKRLVTSQSFSEGSGSVSMDISSLSAGKYYVKILKGNRTLFKKLMINE